MFVKKVHSAGMGAHFYPCIRVSDGRVPVQFLEHIADLQARLIPATLKTVERHHHLLGELPESKLILLPIQDPLAPSLDEGGILNLFPPVWHLPNAIRESAHLHFDDLTIAQLSCQTKKPQRQREPSLFLGAPCPPPWNSIGLDEMDVCSGRPGKGREHWQLAWLL